MMSKSKNPPDWWARVGALAGIVLSVIGLFLAYRSSRWQEQVYQESLEERILVHVMAWRDFRLPDKWGDFNDLKYEKTPLEPEGTIGVEVVNLGMHPLYLKAVVAKIGSSNLTFYEYDPLKPSAALVKLEPGEARNYTAKMDFTKHPLLESSPPNEELIVNVETTKKSFPVKARIDRVTISGDLPLKFLLIKPGRKK